MSHLSALWSNFVAHHLLVVEYSLAPWSTIILEKLTVVQLVKKFPVARFECVTVVNVQVDVF
jgi:hypothetical protein